MLKNFSVTTKIAGGFGLILVLLALTAGQGVVKLGESSDGFTHYRELARDTNLTGQLESNLLLTRINAIGYITSGTQESLSQYKEHFSKLSDFVKEAQKEIQNPKRASLVDKIEDSIGTYNNHFQNFITQKQVENDAISLAQKNGKIIVNGLNTLLESATQREDSFMTAMAEKSLAALYKARLANAYFIFKTKKQKDADKALKAFEIFQTTLYDIQNVLYAPADLGLINEMTENNKQYVNYTRKIIEATVAQNLAKSSMDSSGPVIAGLIEEVKTSVMKDQDILGPKMQSSIAAAANTMTVSSIVTLIAGMLLAFFISRSITVPLKKASIFVKDLADGKLSSKMDVDQKDEVGLICKDMAQVGKTLSHVIAEIDTTIDGIQVGKIGSKADSTDFKGSFAELIDRTNVAVGVLRSFINEVPMPIMTMDKNMKIMFMNKAGTELLGKNLGELQKGHCSDFINTGDCKTDRCACTRAMSSKNIEHGTTHVQMPGSDLDIDYIGVPIEKDGKVVGAMEIILDQTAVRSAQKRMQDVAQRTQVISEQLSSASEELAAQVEQISQGSEVQRERIVETATAMDQMNSTIMEVARNASSASNKSTEAKTQAEEGAGIVAKSVQSITEVHSIAEDLRDNMQALGEKTESISTVMDVISDIADQTNLLALNAAIEAARAGDAGRGFAVVADEVRKLAEKTMTATHEVGDNIKTIQTSVRMNMQEVESAVAAVEDTTNLAKQSGKSLESIVSTVDYSADQVEGIAAASEEQSSASEQINSAISEINNVARETTDGIQQSAKAIQELAVMSNELSELITELRSS